MSLSAKVTLSSVTFALDGDTHHERDRDRDRDRGDDGDAARVGCAMRASGARTDARRVCRRRDGGDGHGHGARERGSHGADVRRRR